MFSRRVPLDLRPNALAEAAKVRGGCPFDLTVSNPTAVGIEYPLDVLAPLADPGGLAYHPDPKGLRSAREAVAASYAARGTRIDPEWVFLCASTNPDRLRCAAHLDERCGYRYRQSFLLRQQRER